MARDTVSPDADPRPGLSGVIETIRQILGRHPEIRFALLFGSRARGKARPDSDLDLALRGTDLDLLGLCAELALATGVEVDLVDLVDLERAGYPLLRALLRDGLVIYQGQRGAFGRWRAEALSSTELDRPWYERMQAGFLRRLAARGEEARPT